MDARGEEVQGAEAGIGYVELRRGWCLGDGDFRQRMLDRAEKALEGKKLASVMGAAVKEHGEAKASKLLAEGLAKLKLNSGDLVGIAKAADEKKALAAWLSQQTLVPAEWIAAKLHMGHGSLVSRSRKWVCVTKEGRKCLLKLK